MGIANKAIVAAALILISLVAFACHEPTAAAMQNEVVGRDRGTIVYLKSRCDYFIVETNMGHAVLEWYGGYYPYAGEIVTGNLSSYGFKDIYNVTAALSTRVWVEDYWLSFARSYELYLKKCR